MTEASAWFLLISPQKIADFSMRVQLSVGLLPGSCGTHGKEAEKTDGKKAKKSNDEALTGYRSTLERQLEALGSSVASLGGKVARGIRGSTLKGRKVAAKYKGPSGELWAGRGATPRWLVAAIKEGKKLEDFLIDKAAPTKKATKRRKKK
jgi:DNA-binding protein H-NS